MKPISSIGLGLFTALFLVHCAGADTLTAPCNADTWIFSEDPDNNSGASGNFATGINAHGSAMRGLLKFDLSGIPAGATINSVSLTLMVYKNDFSSGSTFVLHRMLKSWTEGAGGQFSNTGDFAQDGETTWDDQSHGGASWASPGCGAAVDFNGTASGSVVVGFDGSYTFSSTPGLVADVQAWLGTPSGNFGWLMKDQTETASRTALRWLSHESGNGPSLVVNYTIPTPPPPSPITISQAVRANNQISFTFNADANRTYAVESRGDVASGTWGAASNYSASSVATNFTFSETISATNKFYRVRTP